MKPIFSLCALLASFAQAVHAEPACTQEVAIQKFKGVHTDAMERIQEGNKPAELEKKKIGFVLVAQAAPGDPDMEGLLADLHKLSTSMQLKPRSVCQEADRIRSKHGL